MTIRTRCPSCGTEYYLAEQQAGKQVRCKQCAETIQVPDDKLPEVTSAEVPEKKRTREELPDKPTAAPSAKASAGTSVRKKAGSSSGWGTPLLILTIVGLVIGLPVLACGTAGYFIYRGIKNAAHKFEETWSPHEPADLDEALAYVTSTNQAKEQSGCKWLAKNSIDDDDHARVSKSLDPLLANQNIETRVEAARALKKCATKDNVTSLIAALETTDNFWYGNEAAETRRLAMEMLADLKDERAIAPIAKRLPDPKDRPHASRALISFGARSAPELKRMLEHNDTAVRDEVRSILKAVVPDENNDVLFALGDLRSNDVNRRAAGARALAQVKLDPKYQGEVSKALDARILDGDQNVRLEAANALRVWATGENVSALIQSLALCQDDFFQQRNPETRKIVIEVLGKLGDAKAIPALAERLSNASDRALAGNALIQFGAKAAPDVDQYLTHSDAPVRTEARRLPR